MARGRGTGRRGESELWRTVRGERLYERSEERFSSYDPSGEFTGSSYSGRSQERFYDPFYNASRDNFGGRQLGPPLAGAPATKPAPPKPRRLQATVTDAAGERRHHAFTPSQPHTVRLLVGPGTTGIVARRSLQKLVVFDQPFGA